MKRISKPQPGEYAPYAIAYIDMLPDDGQIMTHLQKNADATVQLLRSLSEEQLTYRYAPDKWTIKDIIQHVVDSERVFAYRALRFARNDATPLPGYDQDPYVVTARANERSIESLTEEFTSVRASTMSLFSNLPDEAWERSGTANDHIVSLPALAFQIAGHELHHVRIIREKYLHR